MTAPAEPPIILAHCELSQGFLPAGDCFLVLLLLFAIEANVVELPAGGGVPVGGSNRSDKSLAEPGENGESSSMSTGEPPECCCFCLLLLLPPVEDGGNGGGGCCNTAETFGGRLENKVFRAYGCITGGAIMLSRVVILLL